MAITGTHINYFFICHRKLWLFANGIQMEHTSELVDEGRFIHETAYPRRAEKYTEIEIDGVKIDFYDARNKIVHEVKKSNKVEEAHRWQVKYYLYILKKRGVEGAKALLEYPKLRRREEIHLSGQDVQELQTTELKIQEIIKSDFAPPRIKKGLCKRCSYHDFCWCEEK
jgi:CRISPR-associated exonuclease Cas4